jgi:hypothetical protein
MVGRSFWTQLRAGVARDTPAYLDGTTGATGFWAQILSALARDTPAFHCSVEVGDPGVVEGPAQPTKSGEAVPSHDRGAAGHVPTQRPRDLTEQLTYRSSLLRTRTLVVVATAVAVGFLTGAALGPAAGVLAGLATAGTLHMLVD